MKTAEEIISILKSFQESAKIGSDGEYTTIYGVWEEDYKDVSEKIISQFHPKEMTEEITDETIIEESEKDSVGCDTRAAFLRGVQYGFNIKRSKEQQPEPKEEKKCTIRPFDCTHYIDKGKCGLKETDCPYVKQQPEQRGWIKIQCTECGVSELITSGICNCCGGKQKNYFEPPQK